MVAVTGSPIREGLPYPLGATWDGKGVNFALFSAHATRVELCLFEDEGERETARIEELCARSSANRSWEADWLSSD